MSVRRVLVRKSHTGARLLEAYLLMILSRLSLLLVPFKHLAGKMGEPAQETGRELDLEKQLVARKVAWAIASACRLLPLRGTCLIEALAGQRMLRRRGIESTLYLGVRRNDDRRRLEAHAWLRAGDDLVTGEGGHHDFTSVVSFASPGSPKGLPGAGRWKGMGIDYSGSGPRRS